MNAVYFANPNSVHVRRWLELLRGAGVDVHGYAAERVQPGVYGRWTETGARGGEARYLAAGLRRRLEGDGGMVHAHNASGYGLMALASGRPYILTLYGSEVYCAPERGAVYTALLRRILRRAARLTCTTPAMRDHVVGTYGVDPERIHAFSMGISSRAFYFSAPERAAERARLGFAEGDRVVVSNRRIRPQYRIDLLVRAFAELRRHDGSWRLVLLEGDAMADCVAAVRALVDELGVGHAVTLVEGFRGPDEVRRILAASDVAVSIPTSDQMSASILEALACGAAVALAPLPAYDELFARGLAARVDTGSPAALAASLAAAAGARSDAARAAALEWLEREHSDAAVTRAIVDLYNLAGVR